MQPLENLEKYEIVLGSASPRRRELLAQLGVDFTVMTAPDVEEVYPADTPAEKVPEYLSRLKAGAFARLNLDGKLIITADTVVIAGGEVLGKPHSHDDAVRMLRLLSGRTHRVVTGVSLLTAAGCRTFSAATDVTFTNLTDEEIEYYISSYEPYDKAGAYGIQEWIGSIGISGINGSFYNVMGLPLCRLYNELKSL